MSKFEMYKDASGQFRFRLKAGNGQNILSSEAYTSKASCQNGIASVKKNSTEDSRYDRLEAKSGKSYFNLKSGNGQVVGTSQQYASASSMEAGIDSVKNNAGNADISDLT